jgi:hypothetical protein
MLVQSHLSAALTAAPDGPIKVVSLCAGQGRDVIGVLPEHPRKDDVTALLIELDPANAKTARDRAAAAALTGVTVRVADAGIVASYADALPADVLLLCGIFGNIGNEDIHRTVTAAAAMCAPGGTVIWTRHRRPADLTGRIRSWFAVAGFGEVAFEMPATATMTGVGVHRRRVAVAAAAAEVPGAAVPPEAARPSAGGRLFTFLPPRPPSDTGPARG